MKNHLDSTDTEKASIPDELELRAFGVTLYREENASVESWVEAATAGNETRNLSAEDGEPAG